MLAYAYTILYYRGFYQFDQDGLYPHRRISSVCYNDMLLKWNGAILSHYGVGQWDRDTDKWNTIIRRHHNTYDSKLHIVRMEYKRIPYGQTHLKTPDGVLHICMCECMCVCVFICESVYMCESVYIT